MNETKSMDGNVFHRLDPKSGLIDPTALQNMSELKMMIENLRQPSHAEHEGSLETPYISYEEVYPTKKAIDLSLIKQSEKKFWQELVDSNIRAGTIACLWCLKAQAVKRLSLAFNKWKVFAAVKTHELILRESQEFQQPDVVTVIDNALAIIRRYKEGGIMNQINQSRDLNGIDVAFPWEERRQQQSGLTAAGILGVNDQAYPYTFDAPARNLDSHQSSLRDTMESTEKEWSFVKSQFRPANVQDIESERQSLLALSYDIIRRGKSNDGNHQSYPPSNPSSPRDSMPPISTDVSKRSSLNLLNPDPVSPRDSGKRFSPHSTSPANRLRNLSPTAVHPPGVSPKASSPTHSIQQPSTILRTGSDEFNYHVNEPAGLFPMKNTPAQTQAYRQKSEARAPSNSRFPENTLQIPSDYHDVNHQHHYSPHFEQRIENRTYPETAQTRQTYPRRSETTERGRTVTPARPLNGSSSASTSAAKVKRPSASSSPTKKPYSEKTLVDMIKFRSSKEGSYVKELLTPREEKSTFDAKQNSVFDESQNLAMFSETANISNTSSMMPRSGRKQGRSISPTDKPRYLLPTNSYRKKVVSGGEAPIMKQRLEREKYPRETQHRAPNNDSLHNREHHSTRQHYTEPHHNHQEFPSTRLSASYQSVSHDGFPLYNSQYTMPHPHTHHSAPQHNTHDHHHHPSSAAPRDNFHSSSNHPTGGKDAEYEYYEQLLKEQQQQFLNYQAQTAIRPQNGQVPVPEFSSISTSAMAGPSNSHDQAEFLSFNQYTAQMKGTANDVSNFNHQPAEQTETHNNLFNQEYHQTSYETSPDQNIPHSEPYDNNYDSMYSLNPNYYNQRGFQSNIQSFATTEPHNNNNSSHSKRGSAKRSPTNKKMDKAQRMLLYGVLHDVLDAKRAWEKNLRK